MRTSRLVFSFLGVMALGGAFPLSAQAPEPLTVLTVGGGPRPRANQVAIESNVRYVDGLLPGNANKRILFGDGKGAEDTVLYVQPDPVNTPAERACRLLFEGNREGTEKFRKPEIRAIDGPSDRASIQSEFDRIGTTGGKGPVLLYFTGHGDQAEGNLDDNYFDLWTGNTRPKSKAEAYFSVKDFALEMKRIPKDRPVTVVMVQCFSGAFANLLFEDGDPTKPVIDRPFCGFFAATRERTAAGCTPEINEADYHDFTSYFFAALSGKDRTGKAVKATDYDKNGVIGMTEAYYYAVINEPSVDVPVATSDLFLRVVGNVRDDEVAKIPYAKIRDMATPAQLDALESLSKFLNATEDDRLLTALADIRARIDEAAGSSHFANSPGVRKAMSDIQEKQKKVIAEVPALREVKSVEDFAARRPEVIAYLEKEPRLVEEVLKAGDTLKQRQKERSDEELRAARWLRLFRVAKTIVLEDRLRKSGDTTKIAQLDRLREMENKNPLK
jgi:hypothetical protein